MKNFFMQKIRKNLEFLSITQLKCVLAFIRGLRS